MATRVWLYVQEYAAPKTIDPAAVQRRRNEALAALPGVTGMSAEPFTCGSGAAPRAANSTRS